MTEFDSGLDAARELIPAVWRRRLYGLFALVGYLTMAVIAGLVSAGVAIPAAVPVVLSVLGALTTGLGHLAATYTPKPVAANDPHLGDPDEELVVEEDA